MSTCQERVISRPQEGGELHSMAPYDLFQICDSDSESGSSSPVWNLASLYLEIQIPLCSHHGGPGYGLLTPFIANEIRC